MSLSFSLFVGAYVVLNKQKSRDPIILGPKSYWGCFECAHRSGEDAERREGEHFCNVCATPLSYVDTVRYMDDSLGNIIYEEYKELDIYKAVTNIGWYTSLDLEDTCELILVRDPECQIETPDIGCFHSYSYEDQDGERSTMSPSSAIRHIEDKHCSDLALLKNRYYEEVKVVYGIVHTCG